MLFEPEIYAQGNANFDAAIDEAQDSLNDTMNVDGKDAGQSVTDAKLLLAQKVRCCICGIMCLPNSANTCINCLKNSIDITEGIPRQLILQHCRECNRY